jgi:SagB-type dehydrogenase family enzyme
VRNIPQHPYPNIGGLDPVEIGVMALNVENLKPGYYVYDKVGHGLIPTIDGNMRLALIDASFENDWMFYAPVVLVISLNTEKVEWKYKTRGYRLAHIDIGAAMENIYLACMAYNLSCCAVAGYNDEKINKLLHYYPSCDKAVGVLIPIGYSPAAN